MIWNDILQPNIDYEVLQERKKMRNLLRIGETVLFCMEANSE